ncbi:hypothetical protein KY339_04075 [Candidatus Woesearchaeota archaeon]|nr:hypothetical protein [Candidatus Woesearchaeota archaeon]
MLAPMGRLSFDCCSFTNFIYLYPIEFCMASEFVKTWHHSNSPLLWVELIYLCDTKKMQKYFGFSYGNHYYTSENQKVTFYKNKETEKKAIEFGATKFRDIEFIKFFIKKTKEIGHELLNIKGKDLIDKFNYFVDKYSDFLAFYRLCRTDFYQKVIDDFKEKYGEENLVPLLKNQFENLDVDSNTKELAIGLKQVGERRFEMHVTWEDAYNKMLPVFEEIGKKLGLSLLEVTNCTVKEINESYIHGKEINLEEVRDRIKHFKFIYRDGFFEIIIPKGPLKKEIDTDTVKGTCASGGKAKGKVVVLHESLSGTLKKDLDRVKKGDILVTNMTSPDMVPATEKAAAIVTDAGGMLCHAAIISRELNIPCVVGTGIATEVFKDGEIVEVDADAGEVRKIVSSEQ